MQIKYFYMALLPEPSYDNFRIILVDDDGCVKLRYQLRFHVSMIKYTWVIAILIKHDIERIAEAVSQI